jgi:nuclear pore complex protein Nup107
VGSEVKLVKSFMRPVLNNWLLESLDGKFKEESAEGARLRKANNAGTAEDEDFVLLRDSYLPETVIGYVSVLHFAGTSLSRDYLLECMELAALIARKDADIAVVLVKSGRMKEIVEGFANCSKALAISASDKKGAGGSSKKMREMGWTRELWTVKR